MIKCFLLLHRAPHLTREEFANYWKNRHSRLAIDYVAYAREHLDKFETELAALELENV